MKTSMTKARARSSQSSPGIDHPKPLLRRSLWLPCCSYHHAPRPFNSPPPLGPCVKHCEKRSWRNFAGPTSTRKFSAGTVRQLICTAAGRPSPFHADVKLHPLAAGRELHEDCTVWILRHHQLIQSGSMASVVSPCGCHHDLPAVTPWHLPKE